MQLHFVVRHRKCSLAKSSAPKEEKEEVTNNTWDLCLANWTNF